MDLDMPSLYKILKDKTRRKIVLTLHEKSSLAYVDLMNILEITNTGKLNYHLKILGDLLKKDEFGKYRLTDKGMLASQLLQQFPIEKPIVRKPVTMRNIALIGFLGFILILINPSILQGFLGVALIKETWLVIISFLYGFLVPGALVWAMSVKRMKTHDIKELAKPPLFSIVLLVVLVIIIGFLWLQYGFRLPIFQLGESGAPSSQQSSDGATQQITAQSVPMGQMAVFFLPIAGVFSYIGILFCEGLYRVLKR